MPNTSEADRRYERRVRKTRKFVRRIAKFIIVISMLTVISMMVGVRFPFVLWIAFFWGISIALEAVDLVLGDGTNVARAIIDRVDRSRNRYSGDEDRHQVAGGPSDLDRAPGKSEMHDILARAQATADEMRVNARRLGSSPGRKDVFEIVARVDAILLSLEEQPQEVLLARDFLNGLLIPVNELVSSYGKLVSHNLESARQVMTTVEQQDFPQILRRLDGVYERLQRGNLIDLEVAREMMNLDTPFDAAQVVRA